MPQGFITSWHRYELDAFKPFEKADITNFVEKYRVLLRSYAAEPGVKRIARTPYIKALYNFWLDNEIKEIVFKKAAQIGATDAAIDLIAYTAFFDPSPMGFFLADQSTAEAMMIDRIHTLFRTAECFEIYKEGMELLQNSCTLPNGFVLYLGWASSIPLTASRPYKYLILDEVDKPGYAVVKTEGSTLGRLRQRVSTFFDHKILLMSTPTLDAGLINVEYKTCSSIFEWFAKCVHCETLQPLRFSPQSVFNYEAGGVVWDGGAKATIEDIEKTVGYKCAKCGKIWNDAEKNIAVQNGELVCIKPGKKYKVGYHVSRLHSLFYGGKLAVIVQQWIEAQKNVLELQNFVNSVLGEEWTEKIEAQEEREKLLYKAISQYKRNIVPSAAIALTAGIDVQKAEFWYCVRAWARDQTSWLIDYGRLANWEQIEKLLWGTEFYTEDGRGLKIWRALIDTGGSERIGDQSSTEEVYQFLRAHVGHAGCTVYGAKGSSTELLGIVRVGKPIDRTPSGRPFGLQIIFVDTNKAKSAFWWRIRRAGEGESGGAYLCADVQGEYFMHVLAEEQRIGKNGKYYWHELSRENHLFDCEILCTACVDEGFFGGLRFVQSSPVQIEKKQENRHEVQNPFLKREKQNFNPYVYGLRK